MIISRREHGFAQDMNNVWVHTARRGVVTPPYGCVLDLRL